MASREQIKNLLPILQAYAEGKTVEYTIDNSEWYPLYPFTDLTIDTEEVERNIKYRIKPEKKSGWVFIYPNGSMSCPFTYKKTAQEWRPDLPIREIYWEE